MHASRLISILMLLQARGRVSAETLAAQLEVSVRTIYRDVDELSAAGVPVYADRGRGGGFQLREGYRTQLTGLTPDEADTLLLAGLSGPAAELGFESAMASAQRKVLAALPAGQAARAMQVRRRVLLDPLDWHRRVERPTFLSQVAQAVWGQRRVTIRYESWTANSTRTVEPFGLVIKAGVWYVVARAKHALRTYKVSQIENLTTLEEGFELPAEFDLAEFWGAQLARFEKELQRGSATLRVSEAAMCRIERLGASAAEAARARAPDASGWRVVDIPIEGIEHAAMELLSFGPGVEVLVPHELRRRVRELSWEILELYPEVVTSGNRSRRLAARAASRAAR